MNHNTSVLELIHNYTVIPFCAVKNSQIAFLITTRKRWRDEKRFFSAKSAHNVSEMISAVDIFEAHWSFPLLPS